MSSSRYRPSLRERLSYAFDSSLSRGPAMLIVWLGVVSLLMIVVLSAIVWALKLVPVEDGANPRASSKSPGWR